MCENFNREGVDVHNPWKLSSEDLHKLNCSYTVEEICQQPDMWQEVLNILHKEKDALQDYLRPILAQDNIRIIFAGAGTSQYIGDILAPALREKLPYRIESIGTTEITANPQQYLEKNVPTLLVSFARSGDSPESIATYDLVEKLVNNVKQLVITCNENGHLAVRAKQATGGYVLLMPPASNDRGFAMTSSFSCMLLAALAVFQLDNWEIVEKNISHLIASGRAILTEERGLPELAAKKMQRVVFIGSGALRGAAKESRLKVLELTRGRQVSIAESVMGFRHGPKSIINDDTMVVMLLSDNEYTHMYDLDFLKELAGEVGRKFKIAVFYPQPCAEIEQLADYTYAIDKTDFAWDSDAYLAIAYILFTHLFALASSLAFGIEPDNPCPSGSVNRVVKGVTIHQYDR